MINKTFKISKVAKELSVSCNFVIKWRDRAEVFFAAWPAELADSDEKRNWLCSVFADRPRSGAPLIYTEEQLCNLMALALKKPTEVGREITHWTHTELADEVNKVCDTYHQAPSLAREDVITVSVDEKTGIQALERISPNKPMKQGAIEKREFEYKRHGTLCLTPSFDVVSGRTYITGLPKHVERQTFVNISSKRWPHHRKAPG